MKIYTQSRIVAACAQFLPYEIVFTPARVKGSDGRVLLFGREPAWASSNGSREVLDEVRSLESYAFEIEDRDQNPILDGCVVVYDLDAGREIYVTLEEFAALRNLSFGKWRASVPTRYADQLYAVSGSFRDFTGENAERTLIVRGRKPRDACRRAIMLVAWIFDDESVKFFSKSKDARRYEVRLVPSDCAPDEVIKFDVSGTYLCKVYDDNDDCWV